MANDRTLDWAAGCDAVGRIGGLDAKAEDELVRILGEPGRREAFRLGERQDEFHVTLQNHYPLSTPANASVELQEWRYEKGRCRLVVWLHRQAGRWRSLENLRYPADAEF